MKISIAASIPIASPLQPTKKPPEGGARAGLIRLWSGGRAGTGRAQISGRADGPGWQTRMNDVLKKAVARKRA
ncbi:BrnA antitoxin family protein [Castellaniella ginsengisoli]|uniref:BrnA antitoxin family protein n=1 Tax=Castellaniella ginsengisoli TaxID=546114 RepID=UPI0034CEBAD3